MEPALAAKGAALLSYKMNPCEKKLAAYREARKNAKRFARRFANDYWLKLSSDQTSADCGNTFVMYEGMQKAFGPSVIKTTPVKSISGDLI
jgi:hypothetical protein